MGEDEKNIPIMSPLLGEREAEAVRRPILSGWVTQGPEVAAFEKEFAEYTGAEYACAVSNCTTALHLALIAAGVKPMDEVITVSHSFIATANSVRYCGAIPVFVDVEPDTFNINPDLLEKAVTGRTSAVLCVHQMGMPCDMEKISEMAKRYSLKVIEDAACAIGSEISRGGEWKKIGRPYGYAACFSFHPRKVITTGDGGMITTHDPEADRKFRLLRQHGMSVPDTKRHESKEVIFKSYEMLGYNYRMTDIQAAVGREQLKRLPHMIERRRYLAERYKALLKDVTGITLPAEPVWARSNWQSFCVRLDDGLDQRKVMQSLLDDGISTRRGIMCAHSEPAYSAEKWEYVGRSVPEEGLPESCRARDESVIIPLYPQMTDADQDRIVGALRRAIKNS